MGKHAPQVAWQLVAWLAFHRRAELAATPPNRLASLSPLPFEERRSVREAVVFVSLVE